MKRISAITTIASAVLCCLFLLLLPISECLSLPDFADDPDGNGIDPHASVAITSGFHCAVSRGRLWFFNQDLAYTGSIICLIDDTGRVTWGGKLAVERTDWGMHTDRYGYEAVSYVGAEGDVVGKARFGELPGVYYRHFESWNEARPWSTLAVSIWYAVVLFFVLPFSWFVRRIWIRFRKTVTDGRRA